MHSCLIKARQHGIRVLLLALAGCVEPYLPEVVDAPTSYLVVDGFINGNGVTRIKLSRTTTVSVATAPPAEKGAKVFIVDNTGVRYALRENASGSYQSDSLLLAPARQYQLRISPATGSAVYESGLVPLKVTPPIDDLKWRLDNDRVQLLVSTHDASQQSRYYRWNFAETWEFHSGIRSYLEYEPVYQYLAARTTNIYTCWRTEYPSSIRQGSSAQLSQDALVDFPYMAIPRRAERLSIRYSVLVSQCAETAEEFAYYELLRKNTEAVGGVNDPLPIQLTGNVHRLDNAAEPVLGFVGAHTVQQKRFFLDSKDLPFVDPSEYITPYTSCRTILAAADADWGQTSFIPVTIITEGTLGASPECADCRLRGVNVKPSFW